LASLPQHSPRRRCRLVLRGRRHCRHRPRRRRRRPLPRHPQCRRRVPFLRRLRQWHRSTAGAMSTSMAFRPCHSPLTSAVKRRHHVSCAAPSIMEPGSAIRTTHAAATRQAPPLPRGALMSPEGGHPGSAPRRPARTNATRGRSSATAQPRVAFALAEALCTGVAACNSATPPHKASRLLEPRTTSPKAELRE